MPKKRKTAEASNNAAKKKKSGATAAATAAAAADGIIKIEDVVALPVREVSAITEISYTRWIDQRQKKQAFYHGLELIRSFPNGSTAAKKKTNQNSNDDGDDDDDDFAIHQRVYVGDLIAFSSLDPDHHNANRNSKKAEKPFGHLPAWRLGQVVLLYTEQEVGRPLKYYCHVRCMLRWTKGEAGKVLTRAEFNNPSGRPESMLLETDILVKISCDQILPAVLEMRPADYFTDKKNAAPELIYKEEETGDIPFGWKLNFFCRKYFQSASKAVSNVADWANYQQQRNVPGALNRGWKTAISAVEAEKTDAANMQQMLEEAYSEFYQLHQCGEIRFSCPNHKRSLADKDDEDPESSDEEDDSDDDQTLETASKKKLITNANRKRKKLENALTLAKATKKRGRPQGNNKNMISDTDTTSTDTSSTPSSTITTVIKRTTSGVLYNPSQDKHRKRQGFKDASMYFYDGVEIELERSFTAARVKLTKKSKNRWAQTWKVRVGDLIAIKDDHHENSSQQKRRKCASSFWHPFNIPWSAAQVLSVYSRENHKDSAENEFWIEVRWLYRPTDLREEIVENISSDVSKELFDGPMQKYQLVEVDENVHQIKLKDASLLGRILTTSKKESANSKWLKQYFSVERNCEVVPQVPMICRYADNSEFCGTSLESVSDWTDYPGPSLLHGPLYRGLFCRSWPGRLKRLRKAYGESLRDRFNFEDKNEIDDLGKEQSKNKKNKDGFLEESLENSASMAPPIVKKWPVELLKEGRALVRTDEGKGQTKNSNANLNVLYQNVTQEFLQCVHLPVISRRCCDARVTAKKTNVTALWTLSVGDVVCIANEDSAAINAPNAAVMNKQQRQNMTNSRNQKRKKYQQWYPFVGPWSFGQVLSIYREIKGNRKRKSDVMLEVRWFSRLAELPLNIQQGAMLPAPVSSQTSNSTAKHEEIYETDIIQKGIPSHHVLGRVSLYFAHHVEASNRERQHNKDETIAVPEVSSRCQYYYLSTHKSFQPLFCAETRPRPWFQRSQERGFRLSSFVQQNPNLAAALEFAVGGIRLTTAVITTNQQDNNGPCNGNILEDLFRDVIRIDDANTEKKVKDKLEEATPFLSTNEQGFQRDYYLQANIEPSWSYYVQADTIVCALTDRHLSSNKLTWTVSVGDVVAVRSEADDSNCHVGGDNYYPYTVPWKACQILAIYRDGSRSKVNNTRPSLEEQQKEHYLLELRWFHQNNIVRNGKGQVSSIPACTLSERSLFETNSLGACDTSMLLGPILLLSKAPSEGHNEAAWKHLPPFIPANPLFYSGQYTGNLCAQTSIQGLVKRGIKESAQYGSEKKAVLKALQNEAEKQCQFSVLLEDFLEDNQDVTQKKESPKKEELENEKQPSTPTLSVSKSAISSVVSFFSVEPLHVDRSKSISYYSEIDLIPDYSAFLKVGNGSNLKRTEKETKDSVWTVKLGDPVIIRSESSVGGTAYGGARPDKRRKNFPFSTKFAVGEVVNILEKEIHTGGQPKMLEEKLRPPVLLEIRWLYRAKEIVGATEKKNKHGRMNPLDCEEVFESDHYDEISPETLICPVQLHARSCQVQVPPLKKLGMHVIEFYCRRFWSSRRKSILPCGSLGGRIRRARQHSKYCKGDPVLRQKLDNMFQPKTAVCTGTMPLPKLSAELPPPTTWRDSFHRVIHKLSLTDASKEAYENGSLIGREKERNALVSFLTSAIRGDGQDGGKSSIFLGGPPGVGKTASVRAAVSELQHQQSLGKVPEFQFITLNGMEMRRPYEAYVRLWEELSENKTSCSPDKAASCLETYFCGNKRREEENQPEGHVAVVLLDEIDYLVSPKQSVLYNFFDWPSRAMECNSKRRLVVVGISNTLNLPERLHPRVQSRIGSKRLIFNSYNVQETLAIIKAKAKQASQIYKVFDDDALIYASKKTAALSGDIRKAFHMCRAAAEYVMNNAEKTEITHPMVRIRDLVTVTRESFNSGHSKAIAQCASFEALLLVSLHSLSRSTGREFGGFDVEELMTKMDAIANASGNPLYLPPPTLTETLGLLTRLGEAHLISLQTPRNASLSYRACLSGSGGAWPIASILMENTVVLLALKDTPHNNLAQKHLASTMF